MIAEASGTLNPNRLTVEQLAKMLSADGISNRANGQLFQGERTHIGWTAREIVLPTIPGSNSSGGIIRVAERRSERGPNRQ